MNFQQYAGTFPFNQYSLYNDLQKQAGRLTRRGTATKNRRTLGIIGTYAIINTLTGRAYVGSSDDVLNRWRMHLARLKSSDHSSDLLQDAYDKDGEHFVFKIIANYPTTDDLELHEREAAAQWDEADLMQYKVGHRWINGHSTKTSTGPRRSYRPARVYALHSISRWFDHTGARFMQQKQVAEAGGSK